MKLLLIGGIIGFTIGVALTVLYFALAGFFKIQADAAAKAASELAERTEGMRPLSKQKAAASK